MKKRKMKIGNILYVSINIIVFLILFAMLAALFVPMLFPSATINILDKNRQNGQYEMEFVGNLTSEDQEVMDDIYISNKEIVNNEFEEVYQKLTLTLGGEDFDWQKYFKFDTLLSDTPFDGRSVEFTDVEKYGLEKPDTLSRSFLYNFALNSRNLGEIESKKFELDPYDTGNFIHRIRMNYSYNIPLDNAVAAFDNLLSGFSNLSEYQTLFKEADIVEASIGQENSIAGLKSIMESLMKNSYVKKMNVDFTVSLHGVEMVKVFVELDYVSGTDTIPMKFYMSETVKENDDISIESNGHFTSVTNIENMVPYSEIQSKYGAVEDTNPKMVDDPLGSGEKIPGVILSEEYKEVIGNSQN